VSDGRGIVAACACGEVYELRPEWAGKLLECPVCRRHLRAGHLPHALGNGGGTLRLDPAFDRDVFLLNQRLAITSKYEVCDEAGRPLLYIERPTYLVRTFGAVVAGLVASSFVIVPFARLARAAGDLLGPFLTFGGSIAAVLAFLVVSMSLRPLRHLAVYRDETRAERVLEVRQDQRVAFLVRTYSVKTPDGQSLAQLSKNYVHNILRKRWYARGPDGTLACTAIEDSVILSLLRRVIGRLFGLLRTNFLIVRGPYGEVIGEFNRKFTMLDRYVLDLSGDPDRQLDRRVALALGVMLDTGERR